MPGIDFAGNGEQELTINKESTNPGNVGSSGSPIFDGGGDSNKDSMHNSVNTNSGESQGSTNGPIDFAGDVGK